jgi:hypothetical protein
VVDVCPNGDVAQIHGWPKTDRGPNGPRIRHDI